MPQSRQLAAIMFTDIVGYTALMGADEKKAFELLKKNREIQKPLIKHYNGTWIKELGDGVLASFHTVTDAVMCSAAIHNACNAITGLKLRIGIHLGEVVFENNDVFGDGVNIASRLQALAPIGGTYISESVYKNVSNKKEIIAEYIREEILKNVSEPIKIYEIRLKEGFRPETLKDLKTGKNTRLANQRKAVFGIGAFIFLATLLSWYFLVYKRQTTLSGDNNSLEKSIAVLPFLDMSAGKDQEYFSDGLSEELMNRLSKISELKVIGRTSSFSFKGKNEDLRIIGEKLGVAHILEGSVQKDENKIRVTVQLIRSADGSHVWSERYDRDLQGIFKLQDEIASEVVKQLKLKFFTTNVNTTSSFTNTEVYNLILQGNYFAEKRDQESLAKALDFYLTALAIDSLNARGWAGVATCYNIQSIWDWIDRTQGYEKAREAAIKALALGDDLAEVHLVLGAVNMYLDFDWDKAEAEYQKALDLEPGNSDVLRTIGFLYRCIGRYDEAIRLTNQSIALDPVKAITHFNFGTLLHYADRQEEAIASYKKVMELNPQFPRIHINLGEVYLLQGKPEMALAEMQQETEKDFKDFGTALAYHKLGRRNEADDALTNYLANYQNDRAYQIAEIYAFRGQKDKSFEWLEKAYMRKENWLAYMKGDPLLKNLESDPRYITFLKKMNLPLD
jgi:TolB-like protein/class 3 adenylate cyclase/Flp pilus assembly protein TadD